MSATASARANPADKKKLTIFVAGQEGDVERIKVAQNDSLTDLLGDGLRKLYPGEHKSLADFDLLIGGVVATDLSQSVHAAGLREGSEVVIAPKDVSRG